jgi:hypothetical protein
MRRLPGEGFDVSGHYVPFAAEYEKERAVRAWCDADLDGDLWEGAPLALNEYPALPGARSFLIDLRWTASADGREVPVDWKVRVVLEAARPGSRAPVYRTQMVFAMMGEVPVAGRPHRAFLFDGDGDGLYTQGHADGLFIDLDDDRSFVVDVMSPEFGPLGAPFQMEGRRLQVVAVDLEGREVSLRESGGGPPGAGIAAAAAAPAPKARSASRTCAGGGSRCTSGPRGAAPAASRSTRSASSTIATTARGSRSSGSPSTRTGGRWRRSGSCTRSPGRPRSRG